MTFEDLKRLQRGIHRMNRQDFDKVLAETIGATRDYTQYVWKLFQDNPIGYMTSRNPERQGQALFEMAWEKGKES